MTTRFVQIAVAILILLTGAELTGGTKSHRGPSSCSMGDIRGNIDYDLSDLVDIADLVYLIDWMFHGAPEPICLYEANVDGSCCTDPPGESTTDINITDLVYLVDFLFTDGPPPAPSPTTERWEKTYGGHEPDDAISVAQADDSGYATIGSTSSYGAGDGDVYLVRTDAWGDTVWTQTYGGSGYDHGSDIVASSDGGWVIAGHTASMTPQGWDAYVLKVDSIGNLIWQKNFGGEGPASDMALEVIVTHDDGYLLAATVSTPEEWYVGCLYKLNASGDSVWAKTYHNPRGIVAWCVVATPDGGYALTGSLAGWSPMFLLKTDSLGDSMWTRTYESGFYGRALTTTDDGGYILVGKTNADHHYREYLYVIKTNAVGDTVWTRYFGYDVDSFGTAVVQANDGGYVIGGTLSTPWRNQDACLIKLDTVGNTVWSRVYGGNGHDYGQGMVACSDGGYIVVGLADSFQSGGSSLYDVYLIKTDAEGYSQ
ncbi:MAG: hypothetical protein OEV49_17220 [candidate division Zixibacteria bacterium]|nr:hypothetical protein [candidate division Zixibacteria bacterium]MDH3937487.1 hypothetical protein [candidate division Zixibacteria bacterium]MDH4034742.1 hypothetical protein [candidate division Zixibacteria bacterium]